jgi:D-galactarolactone isomerase
MIARRTFIKTVSIMAIGASGSAISVGVGQAQQVPNSSGSEPAKLKAPAGACDCHHHIYDAVRFPPVQPGGTIIPDARLEEYRMLQRRIGTSRNVVVTPLAYVTDNRVTLDAIARLRPNARGVAVLRPTATDAELKMLADGGIRGIRFSLSDPRNAPTSIEMIEPLSKRVNALGWHVQINMTADQIVAAQDLWNRLPSAIVFDHLGHVPEPAGVKHPVFNVVRRLVDKGRTWVKLSVTYDNTKDGPPGYADITKVAQAYVKAAPERMVWGSNWPHPNETKKPDDAALFDLMSKWAPDEATRNRILVRNPAALYGFGSAAS